MTYALTPIKFLTGGIGALALLSVSAPALAAGVAAGTFIENTATATYTSGTTTETVDSNTVTILVDELLDVTVSTLDASALPLGSGSAVLSFQLHNSGNGPEAFELTPDVAVTGDDFDPALSLVAWDSNGNNVYDAGIDTVIPSGGATPVIAAEGNLRIFVVVTLAGSPADGDTADVRLTATAVTGSGPAGTKFAGQGTGGGDAIVGNSTAEDDDIGTLLAEIGAVSLIKSATILDQYNGSDAIPGATVTFRIVASVTGAGSVSGLVVTDDIPTGTTYVAASLELDGDALTDGTGDDEGEADSSGIAVDLGTVAGGDSHTIEFSVTID